MQLLIEISSIKGQVIKLLTDHPRFRNSDQKLIASIWYNDIIRLKNDPRTMTAFDLLKLFAENKLTNPETIRRIRQKIQEEIPELRGIVYQDRQDQGEEVRKQINTI